MVPHVHYSGDGIMILLALCSGFLQNLLNLYEMKLPSTSDIIFFGKPYSDKMVLHAILLCYLLIGL